MLQRVTLKTIQGSLEQGYVVTLRIESDESSSEEITGSLPPAPHLLKLLEQWKLEYCRLVVPSARVKPKPVQVTHISHSQMSQEIENSINEWLNSNFEGWRNILDRLQQGLNLENEISFVIRTDDPQLPKLPWHLWTLIADRYKKAEVAFSPLDYKPLKYKKLSSKKQVNILAILGESPGINLEKDRLSLKKLLPHANINFLKSPTRQELERELWEQQYDILYFAGHSSSQDGHAGQIDINQTDSLSLAELKNALEKAIKNGVQLVLLNSCDGLNLARELTDLDLPLVIAMRERIPDVLAHRFLRQFLISFAEGKSAHLAVREARERLQLEEATFLYATWLPVIFQHPDTKTLTWQQLYDRSVNTLRRSVCAIATLVTVAVVGMRLFGLLQPQELWTFDRLMQMRPHEGTDPRIAIVKVTENDFQLPEMQSRRGSLPDLALNRLLQKLEKYEPIAIGLDIFRDFSVNPQYSKLIEEMQHGDRFYATCKVSETKLKPGVPPPPEVPIKRLGFGDLVTDTDGKIRRHLIAMEPSSTSPCVAHSALSFQIVARYFQEKKAPVKYNELGELQIGSVVFPRWRSHMGGYQQLNDDGYQILLNYRSTKSVADVAESVTLEDVLRDRIHNPERLKKKIVLIGVDSNPSVDDDSSTPYGHAPGVVIHAHAISQLLSAVENERPLLWSLPFQIEALWIWIWSILGGILVWYVRRAFHLAVLNAIALCILYRLGVGMLYIHGLWLPIFPAALGFISTGAVVAYKLFPNRKTIKALPR